MSLIFLIGAGLAVAGAAGVVLARPAVHSLLALIVNLACLALLFLTLSGEFLALIQIIVYAGAIMVLFLFVIGLLSARSAPVELGPGALPKQVPLGAAATAAMALILVAVMATGSGTRPADVAEGFGSVRSVGEALFLGHLFPLQLAALILLVAAVGVAILMGRRHVRGY